MFFARFTDDSEAVTLEPADHSAYGWFAEADLDGAAAENRDPKDPELIAARKASLFFAEKSSRPERS